MPKNIIKNKITGKNNQQKIIKKPRKKTIISTAKPKLIKVNLKQKPIILENPLEIIVSAYLLKLNPLP